MFERMNTGMLKEAIEKIVDLSQPKVIECGGKTFSTVNFQEVRPKRYYPDTVKFNTLNGMINMIQEEAIKRNEGQIYVRVTDYNTVDAFTEYDDEGRRSWIYTSRADVPSISKGFCDRETMQIQLRCLFEQTADVAYILDLISRMSDESKVTSNDNGITQTVEARKGISLKEPTTIKSRVKLKPYRTFLEVDQPESEFILRVNDEGAIGIFEADGGVWKLVAKVTIAQYLTDQLQKFVDEHKVVIMM